MRNTIGLLVSLFCLVLSCKEQGQMAGPQEAAQMKKVMSIHDEVMPKMGQIGKLVAELKPKVDSTEMGGKYNTAMKDLQAAHKGMMDWMKGFGDRFDPDEILNGKALSEQKQKWLDEEEVKVKVMRDHIHTSIAKAEALLGQK
ncbi:MAG: hypothetical protein AAFX53_03970 [Bacteroidota bacterium]